MRTLKSVAIESLTTPPGNVTVVLANVLDH
jgi:hypothetical protein